MQRLFRKKAFPQRVWKNARSFFLHQPMHGGGEAESLRQGADKSIKNKTAASAVLFFRIHQADAGNRREAFAAFAENPGRELAVHWIVTSFWHPESPGKQTPPKLNFGPGSRSRCFLGRFHR